MSVGEGRRVGIDEEPDGHGDQLRQLAEQAGRQAAELEAIHRLAQAVAGFSTLDDVFAVALGALEQALGVGRSAVVLFEPDGSIHFRAWRGLSDRYREAVEGRAPWKGRADDPAPFVIDDVLADPDVDELHDAFRAEGIRSMALVPLVHAGTILGRFVLYAERSEAFPPEVIRFASSMASHVAAAIERSRAVDEFVESRARLEAIFASVADGITAQDASGRLVFANDAAAQLCGFDTSEELLAAPPAQILERFEILDEHGEPLPLAELPGRVALATGNEVERMLCYRVLATGDRRWSVVRSTPLPDAEGRPQLAINVFHDVTEAKTAEERLRFLGDVSEALAASLDLDATLRQVARLAVPALADYCLIDLLDDEGRLGRVIIEHVDPAHQRILEEIRERFPPVFNEAHPATRAVATGEPVLYEHVTRDVLEEAAMADEHLELYLRLEPSSYLVVPFVVRGRVLGTISLGTGRSKRRFGADDVALAREVAERAAVALENAQLHSRARESLAQLETVLVSAPAGIGFWDRDLRFLRVNEALAEMNSLPAEDHIGRTLREVVPEIADSLEPLYRRVLETGEPLVHHESTGRDSATPGTERHWLSSYFPVRTADGDITGVGAVILEITERERAQARLRFLGQASEVLAGSLDLPEILSRVAWLAVEGPVEGAAIFLAEGGVLVRAAYAHEDPELEELLGRASRRYALQKRSAHPLVRTFLKGEPELLPDVPPDRLEGLAGSDGGKVERRLLPRSLVLVPLAAHVPNVGVLALWASEPGALGTDELELAVELSRRAGVAIENAGLYGSLRESEQRFRTLADTIPALVWISNAEGACTYFNRRWLEFTGRAVEQELGRGWRESVHPDDLEQVAEADRASVNGQSTFTLEYRLRRHDGLYRWVLDEGLPRFGPDRAFAGHIGAAIDIDDRRRAEERERFLGEASTLLGSSLEIEETLEAVAALAVPLVADRCSITLVADDGSIRTAAVAPAEQPGSYPADESGSLSAEAIGSGEPHTRREIADDAQADAEGRWSSLAVPLVGRKRVIGALTLVTVADSGRRLGDADLALAVELARRAGTAVENARLFAETEFQRALLERQGEASVDGLLVVGADASILSINERYREIWQIPDEAIARGDDAALEAALERVEDPDAFIARVREVYERRETTREDIRFRDGRTIERYGAPVTAPDGSYLGYLWSFRDITERKRVEEQLRQTQRRLASAVSAGGIGTWYWDLATNVVFADEFISDAFGVEPADGAAGLPSEVWIAAIDEEDRARVQAALNDAIEAGAEYSEEFRVTGRGGVTRWILSRGAVEQDAAGRGTRILGAVADLTERKNAERELERRAEAAEALEFVGDGVFLVDSADVVRLWNPAAERITGLSVADVVGRPLAEVLAGWPLEGLGERPDTRPVDLDGRELWLSFSAVAFPEGTVYAFRDLTEQQALERLKTDFVSTVSHELRTPLAAIYGAAMTLQRADVALADEQRVGLLEVVAGESDRLARIVNDILWASRLDSGVLDVAVESCDPAVLAKAVVAAARVHLPTAIELKLTAAQGLPSVAADPDKARQVLVNLLDNAVKYSPDGGLVEVRVEDEGHVVRFTVSDRGLGIPPGEHDRIFEKFFRLDPNLTRGVGGTGLGLYICRELVRRMDGRIWVESDEGVGSTFAFELPVAGVST